MGERRRGESGELGKGFPLDQEEQGCSLLQRAVAVLQSSSLHSGSQQGFQYSRAILVENELFLSELRAFARAKAAAGYSQEELQETFAFLLFDKEEEAQRVCQSGLRVNSSNISTLGDPAKGVYISKYSDCLHPSPWHQGKSGFIVICKLIKGKVRAIPESSPSSSTCPSPGYDCHVSSGSSQYYVYEVSGAGAAERPRQVCPYVLLACQYRPPREMPAPAPPRPAEQNHQEPRSPSAAPCPWRGQLCIGGRRLCTIGLRSRHCPGSVPAQLPPSLDIKHVMGLSDLKKKLPEAAFGKKNYTRNEVCFQGVYSSLYEVEISNKDQSRMDQLVEKLKEKDLAIIKYLQDQGVLILLTSSALAREDGLEPKEPVSLLALFLFSSPRALSPRVEKQEPKDRKEGSASSAISLRIASVLPGLRYALRKAAASSCGATGSPRIQEHLQEYAELQGSSQGSPGQSSDLPSGPVPSPDQDGDAVPSQKLSEQSLARLRRYLSDPGSFTLGISAALQCLSGAGSNVGAGPGNSSSSSSSSVPPTPAPSTRATGIMWDKRELPSPASERFLKSVTSPIKPWGRELRRKSSRILGKSVPPLKAQTHPGGNNSRSREAAKKKSNVASSCPKKPGATGGSNEPMLKLANLQLPHGRKRGAEVLAAEIVHKPQCEGAEKESSAPNGPAVEAKRPKTLENVDTKKIPGTESGTKPGKSKMQKNVENRAAKSPEKQQEGSEREELLSELPSEASSQPPGAEIPRDVHPMAIPSVAFALPGDNSDSHALNLLADLALGSCLPAFIPKDSGVVPVESGDSWEQQSPSDPKSLRVASDHKYHRADKQGKKSTSSKVSLTQPLPEQTDSSQLASPPREKTSGIFSGSSGVPIPAIFQAFPPRQALQTCEVNSHSIISAEHSYASPMPEDPKAAPDPKGNARSAPAAPLVGKVLPFRHQQSGAAEPARSQSSPRRKEEFSKRHTVNLCGNSMKVTCRWEEEYLFHLDSRYTNDSLEKTVIRALHGPWDPDLPDDVEGMKLILHMWVALFYRKPSKLLSSSRKVVEHSNPRKYVSINSSGGFLELSDDSQDCFGFETCPADSGSDPDQTPSSSLDPSTPSQGTSQPEKSPADSQTDADGAAAAVDSTVSSSSGELPCREEEEEEEPSSTSCPESLSLQDHSREKLDGAGGKPEGVPEESAPDVSSGTAEEPAKEDLLDARITPSPPEELGCPSKSPDAPGTEIPGNQTPNSSTAPWTDPPSAPQENGEQQQEKQQEAGSGSGPGPPEDEEGVGGSGHSLEVEDGADPQPACDSVPLEATPGSAEPGGATEEGEECQEPSELSEKEEREVEEEEKENEELEDESSFLGPVDLVLSESSDAEMECEHGEQNPGNSASPEQFGAPEEDPVPSPTSLAPPCPDRSSPAPSDGAGTDPGGFPEEMSPNQEELPDPWDAPGTPESETDRAGVARLAELGSPHGDSGELPAPPEPSLVRGAQPDSVTDSPGPAGATLGNGSEHKSRDQAPSGERWEPAGSAGSPCRPGMSLTLSPDTSSVCLTSPTGSVDPWAAPEDQPMESVQSPSQSDLGQSSCFSQRGGDDADPDPNSRDAEESHQGGNGVLVEEQLGSPSANGTEELDDPMGAGDGRDSPFEYTDRGDDCGAEESEDLFSGTENSPGNDTTNTEMAEIPLHHHLLESEPSSSIREGISAIQELPRQQQSFPNIHGDSAPASPAARDSNPGVPAMPGRRESVLCRLWKPCREGGAAQVSVAAWSLDGSFHPSCSQELVESPAPCSPLEAAAEPGSAPPSPCDPWDDPEPAEPGSPLPEALPGMLPPTPDSARWAGSHGSPRSPRSHGSPRSPQSHGSPRSPQSHGSPRSPWSRGSPGSSPKSHGSPRSPRRCDSPRSCGSPGIHGSPRTSPRSHGSPRSPRSCGSPQNHGSPGRCGSPQSHGSPRSYGSPGSSPRSRGSPRSPRSCGSPGIHGSPGRCGTPRSCGSPRSFGSPRSPRSCGSLGNHSSPRSCGSPRSFGSPRSHGSPRSPGSPGSPRSQAGDAGGSPSEEPFLPEDLEGGSIPSPAPFPARECPLCQPWEVCEHNPEGSPVFPDLDCAGTEVGQGEIPASPVPWDEPQDLSGEHVEFSDAEDISDLLPREEQLPSQDTHEGLAFENPLENSFGDSDQEYLEGNSRSPLPSRSSCIMRSVGAAGTRTTWDSSSRSSVHTEERGEAWDWDVPRDYGSLVVTRQCQERMEHFQLPRRCHRRARESHLARSLLGTWRGLEEITQNTLDMECLRFHYKLKEILRNGRPPFSTSKSLFPTDFPPRRAPVPLSPRSRSPLQVTIPPSDAWPGGDTRAARRGRSRARSRDRGAALRLGRLRHPHAPPKPEPRGDVAGILQEFSEFQRVLLAGAEAGTGSAAPVQGEAGGGRPGLARPRGTAAFRGMVAELCGALRCHLRRVATSGQPGMFYLLETGTEPFFDRVKALLKAEGFVRMEPLSFCRAQHQDSARLLVIIRNEDIASHIHTVPSLLELKRCPHVVFAGVDDPEEVTGDTFQELFQAGGFVVSDEELLEKVTLGQLKEVVKVLERLNRSGRWKWLLHHRESKKLRGDLSREDGSAQRKQLLLRWCQGAELLELLPFHGCDSAPEPRRARCLLELQVQHVRARFAVYLTENASSSCREVLESQGILVADITTFLGTVQKVAAPFRRSYW